MKTTWFTLIAALAFATGARADIITQWNFNSNPPDTSTGTGTDVPNTGVGTISVIGTTLQGTATAGYTSGFGSSDPATADDSAYHTRNYPPQGEGNKTSGIEVRVSTVGFESIVVTWDEQNSATANKYLRFQYSTDGSNFVDFTVLTMTVSGAFTNGRTVNLTPIVAANQNPNFAFRLVSEFEDTATGSGNAGYVATSTTSSYSQAGTMRFDMLTISGSLPDGNAFPTISSIPNQTSRVDTVVEALPFQVGDVETPADQLIVNAISGNQALVSDAGIVIDGIGANRTVTIQPNFDATGTVTITLWVTDGGGKSNSTSFVLTVLPANTPPALSSITNVHTVKNTPFAAIGFSVSDLEDNVATVTASSSDQIIIPDANLVIGGVGANRTLTITPAAEQVGNAVITVTAMDAGGLTATRTFNAMVVSSSEIVLSEPFNYADGPLVANSGRLWTTRSLGTAGQLQLTLGEVLVMGSQSEDAVARLIGGPYDTNGSPVLYASFDVTFIALPTGAPDIFAHFSGINADDLRCRVLAGISNAAAGSFRLSVANITSSAPQVVDYPLDLNLDTAYQVVVCYDVAAGTSKLWVNPASGGAWVTARDAVSPIPINFYGLRQPGPNGRIGDMRIDNLLVGLSFESVTPNLTRVRIRRNGDVLEVYWPSSQTSEGYILESTPSLANPYWQQVQEAVTTVGEWDIVTITNPTGERYFRLYRP